ncbi:hypothetical protein JCM5350_004078 [Sporobolomyces pararoseus]
MTRSSPDRKTLLALLEKCRSKLASAKHLDENTCDLITGFELIQAVVSRAKMEDSVVEKLEEEWEARFRDETWRRDFTGFVETVPLSTTVIRNYLKPWKNFRGIVLLARRHSSGFQVRARADWLGKVLGEVSEAVWIKAGQLDLTHEQLAVVWQTWRHAKLGGNFPLDANLRAYEISQMQKFPPSHYHHPSMTEGNGQISRGRVQEWCKLQTVMARGDNIGAYTVQHE